MGLTRPGRPLETPPADRCHTPLETSVHDPGGRCSEGRGRVPLVPARWCRCRCRPGPRQFRPSGARLEAARAALASVVADLDPARLTGADATGLYASLVGLERLAMAGKTLLAPRIEASGVWREGGHRSAGGDAGLPGGGGHRPGPEHPCQRAAPRPAARHRGGAAHRDALGTEGHRADRGRGPRPRTGGGAAGRGRGGSPPGGAGAVPAVPGHLGARDPLAGVRRIRAARHFSSWTDGEGAFCYQGRDTPDRGAQILSHLAHVATRLRRTRRAAGDEDRPVPSGRSEPTPSTPSSRDATPTPGHPFRPGPGPPGPRLGSGSRSRVTGTGTGSPTTELHGRHRAPCRLDSTGQAARHGHRHA